MRPGRPGREAFTLAELVMVSIILGLIVSAVMEAVHGSRQMVRRVRAQYDAAAHARAALEAMRRDFESIVDTPSGRFTGEALESGAPLPGVIACVCVRKVDPLLGPTHTDVVLVEYRLKDEKGEDGPALLMRRERALVPLSEVPAVRARTDPADLAGARPVAGRIVALKARFWNGKEWRDTWAADQGLPQRIQATLETATMPGEAPLRTTLDAVIPVSLSGEGQS